MLIQSYFYRILLRLVLMMLVLGIAKSGHAFQKQDVNLPNAVNEESEVSKLISQAILSPRKYAYSGSFTHQQGNQARASRITHGKDGDAEIEKLEILDRKDLEYINREGKTFTYFGESKLIQIDNQAGQSEFPTVFNEHSKNLSEVYHFKKLKMSKVAGHACQVIQLTPKDALRYGVRLCLENNTQLVLGMQTLNMQNQVIEQIAFNQFYWGEVDKSKLKPSFHTEEWKKEIHHSEIGNMSAYGFSKLPSGFKKILEIKRTYPIFRHAGSGSPSSSVASGEHERSQSVIQMMFSDGIAHISVFIEPAVSERVESSIQQGAMTISVKKMSNHWITVVGEVPSETVQLMLNSLQVRRKKG